MMALLLLNVSMTTSMTASLVRVPLGRNLGTTSFSNPVHLNSIPTNRGVSRLQSLGYPSTSICHETMIQTHDLEVPSQYGVLAPENNMCRPVFHTVLRHFTTALGVDVSRGLS